MLYCPLCGESLDGNLQAHMRDAHNLCRIVSIDPLDTLTCVCGFRVNTGNWLRTWSDMYDHWRAQYELHSMLHLFTTMENKVS